MQSRSSLRAALAVTGAALFTQSLPAQDAPRFAAPVRLHAGDAFLGVDRLYPSPVFHDVNRDGLMDIVVGDLRGRITIALRQAGDGPARFSAETKLKAQDGKELDFANW